MLSASSRRPVNADAIANPASRSSATPTLPSSARIRRYSLCVGSPANSECSVLYSTKRPQPMPRSGCDANASSESSTPTRLLRTSRASSRLRSDCTSLTRDPARVGESSTDAPGRSGSMAAHERAAHLEAGPRFRGPDVQPGSRRVDGRLPPQAVRAPRAVERRGGLDRPVAALVVLEAEAQPLRGCRRARIEACRARLEAQLDDGLPRHGAQRAADPSSRLVGAHREHARRRVAHARRPCRDQALDAGIPAAAILRAQLGDDHGRRGVAALIGEQRVGERRGDHRRREPADHAPARAPCRPREDEHERGCDRDRQQRAAREGQQQHNADQHDAAAQQQPRPRGARATAGEGDGDREREREREEVRVSVRPREAVEVGERAAGARAEPVHAREREQCGQRRTGDDREQQHGPQARLERRRERDEPHDEDELSEARQVARAATAPRERVDRRPRPQRRERAEQQPHRARRRRQRPRGAPRVERQQHGRERDEAAAGGQACAGQRDKDDVPHRAGERDEHEHRAHAPEARIGERCGQLLCPRPGCRGHANRRAVRRRRPRPAGR